jgi:hypothetical protein
MEPGIQIDGAKRFHHSSLVIRQSSFVQLRVAGSRMGEYFQFRHRGSVAEKIFAPTCRNTI